MRIFVIDPNAKSRRNLVTRMSEALRRVQQKRADIVDGDFDIVLQNAGEPPRVGILGPGAYATLDESVSRFKAFYPKVPLAIVLDNEVYAAEALELRRFVSARIMPIADIAQLAQFVLDIAPVGSSSSASNTISNQGVIAVTQLKGGVGTSTCAAALAACWARHRLNVALVDLDDLNPHLSRWAGTELSEQRLIAEAIEQGKVAAHRIGEMGHQLSAFDGKLTVIGQPELYQESFHLKADVLPDAPSSAIYIQSLMEVLRESFDVVVVDTGRSWGVSMFGLLPLCARIILVTDDDATSCARTAANLTRLYRESDDPLEFDFSKWKVVHNAATSQGMSVDAIRAQFTERELFPPDFSLHAIPFSRAARRWTESSAPGEHATLYDLCEADVRRAVEELAFSIVPFRFEGESKRGERSPVGGLSLRDRIERIVSFLS